MKIQRLYIGDFGILRNQTFEDLHPGVVIIGGLNRAGKTTLMQVLRYLGYGFPQGAALPPPQSKYEAVADIQVAQDTYRLSLQGYGAPVLQRVAGKGPLIVDPQSLYGLDGFTYRQLFTISLDELRGGEGLAKDDQRKLRSALLGAGLKDILLLPELAHEFYKEGEKIGGRLGSYDVRQFKPYFENIQAGQKLKQKGLSQVHEYQEKQKELEGAADQLRRLNKEMAELNQQVIRLDVVKNNFQNYLKINDLTGELAHKSEDRWENGPTEYELQMLAGLQEQYSSLQQALQDQEIELALHPEASKRLLREENKLAALQGGISGIQERLRNCRQAEAEYSQKEASWALLLQDVNAEWQKEQIPSILKINTDHVQGNQLEELVRASRHLQAEERQQRQELERLQIERGSLEKDIAGLKGSPLEKRYQGYFYFSLGFLILGFALSLVNFNLGAWLAGGGIALAAGYLFITSQKSKALQEAVQRQEKNLAEVQGKVQFQASLLQKTSGALGEKNEQLAGFRKRLGLREHVSYEVLPHHLFRIRQVQAGILELQRLGEKIKGEQDYLAGQFQRYTGFLNQFSRNGEDGLVLAGWPEVIAGLEKWQIELEKARKVQVLQEKSLEVQKEILKIMAPYQRGPLPPKDLGGELVHFINKGQKGLQFFKLQAQLNELIRSVESSMASDAVGKAFGLDKGPDALACFKRECRPFAIKQEVQAAYLEAHSKLQALGQVIQEQNKMRQQLESELRLLKARENLGQGQRQIHRSRGQLKILAEKYALQMAAAFLLRTVHENLLRGMKDSVMESAGQIFSRLTSGAYAGIQPSVHSPLEADFSAVHQEGFSPQAMEMLSRGTREQLYLAVRLSRILEVKPNLPLIIDDSFANFDSQHLQQSLQILKEIARSHQIFILTCHSRLLEKVEALGLQAQYWLLAAGRVEKSSYKRLKEHLRPLPAG